MSSNKIQTPFISVLMPTLDAMPYVHDAVASALAQDGADLEVVIRDGLSSDGTVEAIRAIADERVVLQSSRDDGQSDALNAALDMARGEWVIWLNGDDLLVDGAISAARDSLTQDHDVVFGDGCVIDASGATVKYYRAAPLSLKKVIANGSYIFSGSMLIRRAFLAEIGGFRRDLHYCMDFELLVRLALANARAVYVPSPVGALRWHADAKGSRHPWGFFGEHWRIAREAVASHPSLVLPAVVNQGKTAVYLGLRRVRHSPAVRRLRTVKSL